MLSRQFRQGLVQARPPCQRHQEHPPAATQLSEVLELGQKAAQVLIADPDELRKFAERDRHGKLDVPLALRRLEHDGQPVQRARQALRRGAHCHLRTKELVPPALSQGDSQGPRRHGR